MAQRYQDWLAQARQDINAARDSLAASHFEWSAFQSQQAAEKALKALLRYYNYEAIGHTLFHLMIKAREFVEFTDEYLSLARELDRHYIQTRYPNSFASGYPAEFYDEETARRCLDYSEKILEFVAEKIS